MTAPPIHVREYGADGPCVILLHGGPGGSGYMARVARELEDSFRVIEPLQRGSGDIPLTVAQHVADLDEVILRSGCRKPAIVGHSWGAMLALCYAAAHPAIASSIVLIGCGAFDSSSRAQMTSNLAAQITSEIDERLSKLEELAPDPDSRLQMLGDILWPIYTHDPIIQSLDAEKCDAAAYHQTWDDMMRLQRQGVYPSEFASIKEPVLMLHGAKDPHPGRQIFEGLLSYTPQMQYIEWERCGHYPWLEKFAKDEFYRTLRQWLVDNPSRS
jgi:pimeloyl-ACP methyl ester carboxylesterase